MNVEALSWSLFTAFCLCMALWGEVVEDAAMTTLEGFVNMLTGV